MRRDDGDGGEMQRHLFKISEKGRRSNIAKERHAVNTSGVPMILAGERRILLFDVSSFGECSFGEYCYIIKMKKKS